MALLSVWSNFFGSYFYNHICCAEKDKIFCMKPNTEPNTGGCFMEITYDVRRTFMLEVEINKIQLLKLAKCFFILFKSSDVSFTCGWWISKCCSNLKCFVFSAANTSKHYAITAKPCILYLSSHSWFSFFFLSPATMFFTNQSFLPNHFSARLELQESINNIYNMFFVRLSSILNL